MTTEKLDLINVWDKKFDKSEEVNHRKITFINRYGITLAADLYEPKNHTGKLPAIALSGPFGAVKEQSSGLYAQEMARRDVLFFSYDLDRSKILDFIDKSTFYNEIVHVGSHALFWGKYDESEYLKTTYHKQLMRQDFYKKIIKNGFKRENRSQFIKMGVVFKKLEKDMNFICFVNKKVL